MIGKPDFNSFSSSKCVIYNWIAYKQLTRFRFLVSYFKASESSTSIRTICTSAVITSRCETVRTVHTLCTMWDWCFAESDCDIKYANPSVTTLIFCLSCAILASQLENPWALVYRCATICFHADSASSSACWDPPPRETSPQQLFAHYHRGLECSAYEIVKLLVNPAYLICSSSWIKLTTTCVAERSVPRHEQHAAQLVRQPAN
jgi:hypothetical protein